MDLIGNNIANVNTHGFKSARMTFSDAMYQRLASASADNPTLGRAGRNPQQIGLGVNIAGIDSIMVQGAPQRTDVPTDLAIQGEGFFIVSDDRGTFFTRAGNINWNGRTFSINGRTLMGWNAVMDPQTRQVTIEQGGVQPLRTPPEVHVMNPLATTLLEMEGNLNAAETPVVIRPMEFFDSVGNKYVVEVRFTYIAPATPGTNHANSYWRFDFLDVDRNPSTEAVAIFPDGDRTRAQQVRLGIEHARPAAAPPGAIDYGTRPGAAPPAGADVMPVGAGFGVLNFNAYGELQGVGTGVDEPAAIAAATPPAGAAGTGAGMTMFGLNFRTAPPPNPLQPPAVVGGAVVADGGIPNNGPGFPGNNVDPLGNFGSIRFCFANLTQWGDFHTSARGSYADGNPPGNLRDIGIGPDGMITAHYTNGMMRVLGQIPLAMFLNPAGLERMGNSLFQVSANSGPFDGVGRHGEMMPGTLEMSNVDLASEFTEMITTQRGFQANSRIISTSDDMLQELVNLRR
jgi:flagellar hook protein FlgE